MTNERDHHDIALFDTSEVTVGKKLGSGGFCNVFEIKALQVHEDTIIENKLTPREKTARALVADRIKNTQTKESLYAVKFLKPNLSRNRKLVRAASRDLETEARVLQHVDHPNIISIKGCSTPLHDAPAPGESTNERVQMIIMDRLDETLSDRLDKWEAEADRLNNKKGGFAGMLALRRRAAKKRLLVERLRVAIEIASALAYLHSNRMIYRDLKSGNVGFDANTGQVKLFDFGLTRYMPEGTSECHHTFKMSGNCGTYRYMAPEVAMKRPYNETADVYSFSHLLWRMLSLERVYEGYSWRIHRERVIRGGERPPVDTQWPIGIQEILTRAWSSDIKERPSMAEVIAVLNKTILDLTSHRYKPQQESPKDHI